MVVRVRGLLLSSLAPPLSLSCKSIAGAVASRALHPTQVGFAVWTVRVEGVVALSSLRFGSGVLARSVVVAGVGPQAILVCQPGMLAPAVQVCGPRVLTFRDLTVRGCDAGFLQAADGRVVLRNVTFEAPAHPSAPQARQLSELSPAPMAKPALALSGWSALLIQDCRFSGFEAGVVVAVDSQVHIDRSHFSRCSNSHSGGAVTMTTSRACSGAFTDSDGGLPAVCVAVMPSLSVADCTFLDCQSGGDGGALAVDSARLYVLRTTFVHSVGVCGGAVVATGPSSALIVDSVFTGDSAMNGGAVCLQSVVLADIAGCSFNASAAANGGGAVFSSGASALRLASSSFVGCGSGEGGGGTLMALPPFHLPRRGFMVELLGVAIRDSTTLGNGGAVYFLPSEAGVLAVSDSVLLGEARRGGGGVFFAGAPHAADAAIEIALPGLLSTGGNDLEGSTATYGDAVATSARRVVLVCPHEPTAALSEIAVEATGSSWGSVSSYGSDSSASSAQVGSGPTCGSSLDMPDLLQMRARVVDGLGQFCASDDTAVCTLSVNDSSVVVAGNVAITRGGEATFSSLKVLGRIGARYSLQVRCALADSHVVSAAQEPTFAIPPCPPGHEASASRLSCIPCSHGHVAPEGQAVCLPCPAGTYTDGTNRVSCFPCPRGTFNPLPGMGMISSCRSCLVLSDHLLTLEAGANSSEACICARHVCASVGDWGV